MKNNRMNMNKRIRMNNRLMNILGKGIIYVLVFVSYILLFPKSDIYAETRTPVNYTLKKNYFFTSIDDAGSYVRNEMLKRQGTINVRIKSKVRPEKVVYDILYSAFEETGYENEGGYLWGCLDRCGNIPYSYTYEKTSKGTVYYVDIIYNISFITNSQQEQYIDEKLDEILMDNDISIIDSQYERVRKIYYYLCRNVEYDTEGLASQSENCYSPYYTLRDGKGVCQGYALLLYRMLHKAGIDSRLIESDELLHAWNTIKIGNYFYNVDVTWDDNYYENGLSFNYFLKGSSNFVGHSHVNAKYRSADFLKAQPLDVNDFDWHKSMLYNGDNITFKKEKANYAVVKRTTTVSRPKIKSIKNIKRKKITVKFGAVANAYRYEVFCSKQSSFSKAKKSVVKSNKATIKVSSKGKYYVKVRAYRVINGRKKYSKYSRMKNVVVSK